MLPERPFFLFRNDILKLEGFIKKKKLSKLSHNHLAD